MLNKNFDKAQELMSAGEALRSKTATDEVCAHAQAQLIGLYKEAGYSIRDLWNSIAEDLQALLEMLPESTDKHAIISMMLHRNELQSLLQALYGTLFQADNLSHEENIFLDDEIAGLSNFLYCFDEKYEQELSLAKPSKTEWKEFIELESVKELFDAKNYESVWYLP